MSGTSLKATLPSRIKVASPAEREFYERVLYPLQDNVLSRLARLGLGESIYLTGGTALARFHYHHRYSDDLHFSVGPEIEIPDLINLFRSRNPDLNLRVDISNPTVGRFLITTAACSLKFELLPDLDASLQLGSLLAQSIGDPSEGLILFVNDLPDLAATKLLALDGCLELRDLVDLEQIAHNVNICSWFDGLEQKGLPLACDGLRSLAVNFINGTILAPAPIPADRLEAFVSELGNATEEWIEKKVHRLLRDRHSCNQLVSQLLWDHPAASRLVTPDTVQLLRERVRDHPIYQRLVIQQIASLIK